MSQNLFENFKKSSKSDWTKKATKDLKGDNPLDKFKWFVESELEVLPYYDIEDVNAIEKNFQNRLFKENHPTGEQRHWDNLEKIIVKEEDPANDLALKALTAGTDGLIFKISPKNISYDKLLKNIQLQYCQVWFEISHKNQLDELSGFISNNTINGGLFCDSELVNHALKQVKTNQNFRIGLLNQLDSNLAPTDQISEILYRSNKLIQTSETDTENLLKSFAINYQVNTDFFGEIAAIKALRQLFFQVAQAYEVESFKPEDLHIHTTSTAWSNADFDPHGNMLKGTSAAMASIIGGCDSIYIEPEDYENKMMRRVARNVSNILKEESYFTSNVDPSAGSYYIESLTDLIAKSSWNKFQKKVNS